MKSRQRRCHRKMPAYPHGACRDRGVRPLRHPDPGHWRCRQDASRKIIKVVQLIAVNLDPPGVGRNSRRGRFGRLKSRWSASDGSNRADRLSRCHDRHRSHRKVVGTTPPTRIGEWRVSRHDCRPLQVIASVVCASFEACRACDGRDTKTTPSPIPRHRCSCRQQRPPEARSAE
jgi:hypothetical protein